MFSILLADASPWFRLVLREMLARHFPFMHIAEAGNSKRAVALGVARHPQLALIDVKFPDGSGLDLARWFKSRDPATIVCLVAHTDIPEYRIAARDCGADHFIVKGESNEASIVSLVESAISRCFRILLVDHNEGLSHRVTELLTQRWPAMVVVGASTGLEAITDMPWFRPDVVIINHGTAANHEDSTFQTIRRHPDADLVVITRPGQLAISFSPPSSTSKTTFRVRLNEHFGEELLAAISAIIAARVGLP